jgi:hypothetical protein
LPNAVRLYVYLRLFLIALLVNFTATAIAAKRFILILDHEIMRMGGDVNVKSNTNAEITRVSYWTGCKSS